MVTKILAGDVDDSDVDDSKFPTTVKLWGFTIEIGNPAELGM